MSTNYKLLYFNIKAKGELVRYIFKYANVDFEDDRSPSSNWAELKTKTPFGQVPVLYFDDQELAGSLVIARYLAEKFGLSGSNEVENAKVAAIVDTTDDVSNHLSKVKYEKDETRREDIIKFITSALPMKLKKLEDCIGPEGWIFGNKPTYADFAIHIMVDNVNQTRCFPNMFDKFPKLVKLQDDVADLPAIKKWIQERPNCTYYNIK